MANALGQDVSKLAAQEKRLLLSRLPARFAHEARNPLSSLNIHVQLLEKDIAQAPPPVREKTASRFEIIHGELHRLENIVKHFLSLAGPSSLDLHPVEIAKVVGYVCELLRPEAASRGIEIVMKLPDSLPAGALVMVPSATACVAAANPLVVVAAIINTIICTSTSAPRVRIETFIWPSPLCHHPCNAVGLSEHRSWLGTAGFGSLPSCRDQRRFVHQIKCQRSSGFRHPNHPSIRRR